MRQLVIDSASEACTLALFEAGVLRDSRHEILGRGHAERLVPLIAALADGGRAEAIIVGCGPGSFAGVRIAIAAARGLALGWGSLLQGFSTLALIAASAGDAVAAAAGALVVVEGGHGQWFVQPFGGDLSPRGDCRSLLPQAAVAAYQEALILGNRAEAFVALRGAGRALPQLPDARGFARLPPAALSANPAPVYGRAPDARPAAARGGAR